MSVVFNVILSTDKQTDKRTQVDTRVGHGLGPSRNGIMDRVGLGWVRVFLIFGGLGGDLTA